MDELDRMCARLVQVARASNADVLTRPFEIAQVYQALIPYRTNRRELGLETMEDYELTLLRLLSGERGYVISDERTQSELRAEVESRNPDLSRYRAFATTEITLAPEAVRAFDPATVRRTTGGQPAAQAASERPTVGVPSGGGAMVPPRAAASAAAPASPAGASPAPSSGGPAARATPTAGTAPAPVAPPAAAAAAPAASAARPPRATPHTPGRAAAIGSGCRYCGGELPDGRPLTFCPHCGQNLTVRQCPACGTELDVAWKFCITCGRSMG